MKQCLPVTKAKGEMLERVTFVATLGIKMKALSTKCFGIAIAFSFSKCELNDI